ncbi:MAG: hypothetical protein JSS07_04085 [Proteobacteria bacterium]|nr:hypothetical protein [Pseudomonadota bacterium]
MINGIETIVQGLYNLIFLDNQLFELIIKVNKGDFEDFHNYLSSKPDLDLSAPGYIINISKLVQALNGKKVSSLNLKNRRLSEQEIFVLAEWVKRGDLSRFFNLILDPNVEVIYQSMLSKIKDIYDLMIDVNKGEYSDFKEHIKRYPYLDLEYYHGTINMINLLVALVGTPIAKLNLKGSKLKDKDVVAFSIWLKFHKKNHNIQVHLDNKTLTLVKKILNLLDMAKNEDELNASLLNLELYQWIRRRHEHYSNQKLHNDEYDIIKNLLNQGADPNFSLDEPYVMSWIEYAINSRDFRLYRLLLNFRADVNLNSLNCSFQNYSDRLERSLRMGSLPIQKVNDLLKEDYFNKDYHSMYSTILAQSHQVIQNEFALIQQIVNEQYELIHSLIVKELSIATEQGKRLMILIGESHISINSLLVECIIALICFNQLQIDTVFLELCKTRLDYLDKEGKALGRENIWHSMMTFYQFIKQYHNIKILPVDLGWNGATNVAGTEFQQAPTNVTFDNSSQKGLEYRDLIISQISDAKAISHVIEVVGVSHIYDLMNNTTLTNRFHVVPINASGFTKNTQQKEKNKQAYSFWKQDPYEELCIDYYLSDQVHQFTLVPRNSIGDSILSPEEAIRVAKVAHGLACKKDNKAKLKFNS